MNRFRTHTNIRTNSLSALMIALGLAFGCSEVQPAIEVVDVVSHPSAGVPVGVVYLRVLNESARPDRLSSANADVAESTELHETVADGDMMRMIHRTEGFEVPAKGVLTLESGGKHIMLTGLAKKLEAGSSFGLDLVFERAGIVHVVVPVRPRSH